MVTKAKPLIVAFLRVGVVSSMQAIHNNNPQTLEYCKKSVS